MMRMDCRRLSEEQMPHAQGHQGQGGGLGDDVRHNPCSMPAASQVPSDEVSSIIDRGDIGARGPSERDVQCRELAVRRNRSRAELPEGDGYPVGNVHFTEAEAYCRRLTELAREAGELPEAWEFRLPTKAQSNRAPT